MLDLLWVDWRRIDRADSDRLPLVELERMTIVTPNSDKHLEGLELGEEGHLYQVLVLLNQEEEVAGIDHYSTYCQEKMQSNDVRFHNKTHRRRWWRWLGRIGGWR